MVLCHGNIEPIIIWTYNYTSQNLKCMKVNSLDYMRVLLRSFILYILNYNLD